MAGAGTIGPSSSRPQRFYRLNLTALSWSEIWEMRFSVLGFVLGAPTFALNKLLHRVWTTQHLTPGEIVFAPVAPEDFQRRIDEVGHLVEAIKALGFDHFSTYKLLESPLDAAYFVFVDPAERAYGMVLHAFTEVGVRWGCAFTTLFGDDGSLLTYTDRHMAAFVLPPRHRKQPVIGAAPADAWRAHVALRERLAPEAGGITWRGTSEFAELRRRRHREMIDYCLSRGLLFPAEDI